MDLSLKQKRTDETRSHIGSSKGEDDWEVAGVGDVNELNGIDDAEYEYVRKNLLIDSGASICGTPKEDIGNETVHPPEGQAEFSTANAQTVPNEGTVEMRAAFQNGLENHMRFKVLKIKRMIASVSMLVKSGHRVVFDDDKYGSYIYHKKTGKYIQMYERGGVYVVPMWVKRRKESGFTWQPERA